MGRKGFSGGNGHSGGKGRSGRGWHIRNIHFWIKEWKEKKTALRLGILRDLIYGSVAISAGRFEDKSAPDYFRERRLGQSDKPTAPVVGWGQCGLGHSVPVSTPVLVTGPKAKPFPPHPPRERGSSEWLEKKHGLCPSVQYKIFSCNANPWLELNPPADFGRKTSNNYPVDLHKRQAVHCVLQEYKDMRTCMGKPLALKNWKLWKNKLAKRMKWEPPKMPQTDTETS